MALLTHLLCPWSRLQLYAALAGNGTCAKMQVDASKRV
ncbi:hypothetical protein BOH78_2969 [Pichia kudriavzevii]|uniref:Uncharacterized protein n=1 Tax=Pichia kudriavzevii TaxID=4909 RepID=A0A1V2LLD0_PICKU|nr:hypothetical protein BOH78_2969 [Pichia kudriavzevii]